MIQMVKFSIIISDFRKKSPTFALSDLDFSELGTRKIEGYDKDAIGEGCKLLISNSFHKGDFYKIMLSKKDLVSQIREDLPEFTLKDIEKVIDVAIGKIIEATVLGEGIRIVNFASIKPSVRKAYVSTHPLDSTTEIFVPERRTISFQPSEFWKKQLNK